MLSIGKIASRQLSKSNASCFSIGKKRKPTPNDLPKYDVVVVGAGLGNVLAAQLDSVLGDKAKIYLAYDNLNTQFYDQRDLYEQGLYICL